MLCYFRTRCEEGSSVHPRLTLVSHGTPRPRTDLSLKVTTNGHTLTHDGNAQAHSLNQVTRHAPWLSAFTVHIP